jgi:amino acid transporter
MTEFPARMTGSGAHQTRPEGGALSPLLGPARPLGPWALAGVAVASFGGPLALAALNAPSIAGGAVSSAGLSMVLAAAAFGFPLAVWFGYARHVSSSGGLYAFTEAAAGRRVALVQACVWAFSYLLYVVYTTAQIVYDLLPVVLPGEKRYQSVLEVAIPVVLAGVMIAGRRVALLVIGLIAVGQLALAVSLSGVTLANVSTPASSSARPRRPGRWPSRAARPRCCTSAAACRSSSAGNSAGTSGSSSAPCGAASSAPTWRPRS